MSSTISNLDSSYVSLINAQMTIERQPLDQLTTRRDDIKIQQSIYQDLSGMLDKFQASVKALNSTDSSYALASGRSVSVSDVTTGTTVLKATASSSAATDRYSVSVTSLAKAHRVRSNMQAYANQSLGLSGTVLIGGNVDRSVSSPVVATGTVDGFATGTVDSGQLELGTDSYYVETRQDTAGAWQFRLVNSDGKGISIKNATGTYTDAWQSVPTAGGVVDTGRGLKFTLGATPSAYQTLSKGGTQASVAYTAKGAGITVKNTDSLIDIAYSINNATYADGNGITASIVNNQLVLTSKRMGAGRLISAGDQTGTVLTSLGILSGGAFANVLQNPSSAQFSVNGMSMTRSSNSGLTDVINGITLDLATDAEGKTATLDVVADTTAEEKTIGSFIDNFNGLVTYLGNKVATTKQSDGTYQRGALAGDTIFSDLRMFLLRAVNSNISNSGLLKNLSEIGITLDNNLKLTISDSSKLKDALKNNKTNLTSLVNGLSYGINTKIGGYTGTTGYVSSLKKSTDEQITSLGKQIDTMNTRLDARQQALEQQYAELQTQLMQMTYLSQQFGSLYGSYSSRG